MENSEIAQILIELRATAGKTQAEFAKLAGVSQRTWSSYESGQTRPKAGVLWALAANGYPITGLTNSLFDDMAENLKISKAELQKRAEIARLLATGIDPDAPAEVLGKAVEDEYQKQNSVEARLASLESTVSSMGFRLASIETLLQRMLPPGGPKQEQEEEKP